VTLSPEERERRAQIRAENARRRAEMPPCPCVNWSVACMLRNRDYDLWLGGSQPGK
jgi:hypothetical protein